MQMVNRRAATENSVVAETVVESNIIVEASPSISTSVIAAKDSSVSVGIRMFINDDPGARSAAFGSVTIASPIGELVLDNLRVLRDQKSGNINTLTPFKVTPDKTKGGRWVKCGECGELVADSEKATRYDNPYHGEGSNTAKAIFTSAFNACDTCDHRKLAASKLAEMKVWQEKADILEAVPDEDKTAEQAIEYAELMNKLANVYRRCTSTPAFSWDGTACSCKNRQLSVSDQTRAQTAELVTTALDEAIAGFTDINFDV